MHLISDGFTPLPVGCGINVGIDFGWLVRRVRFADHFSAVIMQKPSLLFTLASQTRNTEIYSFPLLDVLEIA